MSINKQKNTNLNGRWVVGPQIGETIVNIGEKLILLVRIGTDTVRMVFWQTPIISVLTHSIRLTPIGDLI